MTDKAFVGIVSFMFFMVGMMATELLVRNTPVGWVHVSMFFIGIASVLLAVVVEEAEDI